MRDLLFREYLLRAAGKFLKDPLPPRDLHQIYTDKHSSHLLLLYCTKEGDWVQGAGLDRRACRLWIAFESLACMRN